jgi:DNA repair protein RadC
MNKLFLQTSDGFAEAAPEVVQATAVELTDAEIKRRGPELEPGGLRKLIPSFIGTRDHEFLGVGFFDPRLRLIDFKIMAEGGSGTVGVPARDIIKAAIVNNAWGIVIMHNHPGATASPSDADKNATRTLARAAGMLEITLFDHWVVTGSGVYSFKDHGLLGDEDEDIQRAIRALGRLIGR